ncbi:MAG: asparaginyl/glutamyl-tRNA amidotransferase subunit C [Comamonas sp. SCN 67-35]|uniref:Asp-tRNA(Asn)/Glu-tRNA(Gln) amidotransferase subunit GatC n=1 Tax=unclassified Comamonas TaxID=2638500 RepID=UPI00086DD653|nr:MULTISPECIES: Asp-tRNA(Asn)/Glu-tRNA(Gln) amidotransferase subunit GatC [unclassified Comamonas]MBN9330682.1 Asp-tRNA(Asn)/Glu-tRNA(Gln) amidotransferase subunit GatC [Comamonas sp.]ODU39923.1 MAG: asparaginyl/glutamyl-tRNA amidotransferase subunit C [Comamonas sp. SCN 67-35]OJW97985.1 MAG: asparaginyl/glutamyl-tRNA amidotransferase subunit C [Burkholderiales bacterium 66-26]
MALTPEDITRIARLARLELSVDEAERMRATINDFFTVVEQMQAVDTSGIKPLAHPLSAVEPVALRLMDDAVSEPNEREAYLVNAPAAERGLFLVPRVIE